jgi:methylenetetrahydrofolate reductase (NADPH)
MQIRELLAAGRTYSFEFFPPKTEAAQAQLRVTLKELQALAPSFVSVTDGAGGSTRALTQELVVQLHTDTAMTPMAHLTCAAFTRGQLETVVATYRDAGVENILALRGDPPAELDLPPGDLHHANELVELIRGVGEFSVGVAAHPEGHPASLDATTDRDRQAAKLAAADFGITQFFFDAELYPRFLEDLAARGTTTPVIPGIMPVTNIKQVARMAQLSGADFPEWLADRLRAVEEDAEAMHAVGIQEATRLCERLLDYGAPGLHFYTLNRSPATREIYRNLGLGPSTTSITSSEPIS